MKHIILVSVCLFLMGERTMTLTLKSPAFQAGTSIPSPYTCDGSNISPPLEWTGAPEGTKSFVLLMDDPDVPKNLRPDGMWDHWVLFNIPPSITKLTENASDFSSAIQGKNTGGQLGYTGPCPPDRQHRYFFKLYALDTMLELSESATKAEVQKACEGHILEEAELMGVYDRKR